MVLQNRSVRILAQDFMYVVDVQHNVPPVKTVIELAKMRDWESELHLLARC